MRVTGNTFVIMKQDLDDARDNKNKTESGIHVPDTVKDKDEFVDNHPFEVRECGPLCKEVKVGDKVFLNDSARGLILSYGGEKRVLFKEHDIIAIL